MKWGELPPLPDCLRVSETPLRALNNDWNPARVEDALFGVVTMSTHRESQIKINEWWIGSKITTEQRDAMRRLNDMRAPGRR